MSTNRKGSPVNTKDASARIFRPIHLSAFLCTAILIGSAVIGFGSSAVFGVQTAANADVVTLWEGSQAENGSKLLFTLKYEDKKAIVHISGPRYACTLTGRPLRKPTIPDTGNTYSITPSGGKCDAMLGGTMILDRPEGMPATQFRLQTFKANKQRIHTLVLTEVKK